MLNILWCFIYYAIANGTYPLKRKTDVLGVFGVADHESDISFSIWGIFTKISQLLPRFENSFKEKSGGVA